MKEKDAIQLNSLSLAFLGDSVFTLFVREYLLSRHDGKSGLLHKLASNYVCAAAQAKMIDGIADELTETESEIARRARNCHTASKAKNASLSDYKKATMLEAVLGYLKITGNDERLNKLMNRCIEITDGGKTNE